jgi:hypothetical protein
VKRQLTVNVGQLLGWAAALVAGIALGIGATLLLTDDGEPDSLTLVKTADAEPREYMYLDAPRVRSYLAQYVGGTAGPETQNVVEKAAASAGAAASGLTGEISREREAAVQRVVSPTAASQFTELQDLLAASARVASIPVSERFDPSTLREGGFVRIEGVRLRLPLYARPYFLLRYPVSEKPIVRLRPHDRQRAGEYVRRIGENPRIVFVAEIPTNEPRTCFRVHVPVRYGLLTDEWSLYSNPTVTVVGKVTRTVTRETDSYSDPLVFQEFDPSLPLVPRGVGETGPDHAITLEQARTISGTRQILERPSSFEIENGRRRCRFTRGGAVVLPTAILS